MQARLLVKTIQFATGLALATAGNSAYASDLQSDTNPWQSFENQMMVDVYKQSNEQARKQLNSNLKSAAVNAFSSLGVSGQTVQYMGAAISLATQDTRIHLNDSKSLLLELMDVSQSDRALFFGYQKAW